MQSSLRLGFQRLCGWLGRRTRRQVALALCLVAVAHFATFASWKTERVGDRIQVALPVLALACGVMRGDASDFALRFAGNMTVVHGLKNSLGRAEVNFRPSGSTRGFPSGHTAAAVQGASYLVRQCGSLVPYAGPLLALGAGFVAGSRIEAGKHDLRQVLGGAVIGLGADLSFRQRRSRRRVALVIRRIQRRLLLLRPRPA